MSPRAAARSGFTLLETILVLALIGVLAGGIFGFLWDITGRRDVLARASADGQAGSAVIERIEADLTSGLAGGGGDLGAGVHGTDCTLKVLTRGVDLPTGTAHGDLQASEYSFSGGVLRARRWNIGAAAMPEFETVCDHVEAFRFRYYDGREWKSSFDSLSGGGGESGGGEGLPVAVEVALWFGTPKPPDETAGDQPEPKPSHDGMAGDPTEERAASGRAEPKQPDVPARRPDRLRLIVVPDGPVAAWKELR